MSVICPNGLGNCPYPDCILEACHLLKEYKLMRLQEWSFRRFWDMVEIEEILSWFDKPMPELMIFDFSTSHTQPTKTYNHTGV